RNNVGSAPTSNQPCGLRAVYGDHLRIAWLERDLFSILHQHEFSRGHLLGRNSAATRQHAQNSCHEIRQKRLRVTHGVNSNQRCREHAWARNRLFITCYSHTKRGKEYPRSEYCVARAKLYASDLFAAT